MSETLNLNTENVGMWAQYRKKCKNKEERRLYMKEKDQP